MGIAIKMNRYIVRGQNVDLAKKTLVRELRGAMTPEEQILWKNLRRNQLQRLHFRRQQLIDGFVADFYCHSIGLVVEVDGSVHDGRKEYDVERDGILKTRGLSVLRFRNEEIRESLPDVLGKIAAFAANLTPQPPSLGGKGE